LLVVVLGLAVLQCHPQPRYRVLGVKYLLALEEYTRVGHCKRIDHLFELDQRSFPDIVVAVPVFCKLVDAEHVFVSVIWVQVFLVIFQIVVLGEQIVVVGLVFVLVHTGGYVVVAVPFLHARPAELEFAFEAAHAAAALVLFDAFLAVLVWTLFGVLLDLHHVFIVLLDPLSPIHEVVADQGGVVLRIAVEAKTLLADAIHSDPGVAEYFADLAALERTILHFLLVVDLVYFAPFELVLLQVWLKDLGPHGVADSHVAVWVGGTACFKHLQGFSVYFVFQVVYPT